MKLYCYKEETQLKLPLKEAWQFFSNPYNLPDITPKTLNFRILSTPPAKIYPGLIIHYTVSPIFKLPLQWVTEISHVIEEKIFVDEQRYGPYAFWHHQHIFEENSAGVLMTDLVHYRLHLDPFSRLIHKPIIRPQIEEIFSYRRSYLEKHF